MQNVLGLLASVLIVLVFTIFMLIRREDLRNRLISLAGDGNLQLVTQTLDDASARVSRYLLLQFVVNACYGIFIGACLHFIGLPGALLWGVIVGTLRFLPYIGPPLGGIMPLLLSLAVFDGWTRPLDRAGAFCVYGIDRVESGRAVVVRNSYGDIVAGDSGGGDFLDGNMGPYRAGAVHAFDGVPAGGGAARSAAEVSADFIGRRAAVDAGFSFLPAPAGNGSRRGAAGAGEISGRQDTRGALRFRADSGAEPGGARPP